MCINSSLNELDTSYDFCEKDNNQSSELLWKDAKDITTDDIIMYSIPQYEKDVNYITHHDCFMYGILMSNNNNSLNGPIYSIDMSNNANRKHLLFCIEYLNTYNITINHEYNIKLSWNKSDILPFRHNDFYDESNVKRIHSKWLNLPIDKIKCIIRGMLLYNNNIIDDVKNEIVKTYIDINDSEIMVECIRYLFLRIGILTSGTNVPNVPNVPNVLNVLNVLNVPNGTNDLYCLKIPMINSVCILLDICNNNNNNNIEGHYIERNGFIGTQVTTINKYNYKGTLYDLQMDEIHNYMIHNGIIHNGGGRRNGSFAIYLEPWHPDIELFLEMKKNHGDEEMRARDLFYALWIPDLFMEKVKTDQEWHYFCPDECRGLSDVYGNEFVQLYNTYVAAGKARKVVKARDLWFRILDSQMETGTPYILYKDAANSKSNQKNLGTIKSSNLCTEIMEYSDAKQTAVCNLASISLSKMVQSDGVFDYDKLHSVVQITAFNLNRVIDVNFYPTEKTEYSNFLHRPIGIGVQGLSDALALMDIPFHSEKAKQVNKKIFETLYHGAMFSSMIIAKDRAPFMKQIFDIMKPTWKLHDKKGSILYIENDHISKEEWIKINPRFEEVNRLVSDDLLGSYSSFIGSPLSEGKFQFDLWNIEPNNTTYNWDWLREQVCKYGVRNSLLIAPMPTASTSQILGNNECFEPITSNIYTRRTSAGEFIIINKHLMRELIQLGIWSNDIKNNIIENNGSIQQLTGISDHIKEKYKTVWEIPMRHIIDMASDRGSYICQSQSLNLWMEEPNYNALTSMHFDTWS